MSISVQAFHGEDAQNYIEELARLRIEVFHEFPYRYEGDMNYEARYLQTFLDAPDSVLVIAFDGRRVVGASTGLPFAEEVPDLQAPFLQAGYDIDRIFYYGESVLKKAYRGRGVGVRFFEEREKWARSLNRFDWLTFCAVVRPPDHPRRPAGYTPLDEFWKHRGFAPTDLLGHLSWREIGETEQSGKALRFWMKKVEGQKTN